MTKGLVSVIMPVYKVEAYLATAIESVMAQTYPHWELLIINDGSPDNSAAIAEVYVQKDPRIRQFHKPNGGLSDARNFGLERAQGEFIYFIDSDDWIEPILLEITVQKIENEQVPVVIFGYILDNADAGNQLLSQKKIFHPSSRFDKKTNNLHIDENLMGIIGYAWNKLYRHDFIKKHQLHFDKGVSLVEDILFNAQVYRLADSLVVMSDCLYHYLNRPVSTLIKTYHEGAFSLYLKKYGAVDQFLQAWNVKDKKRKTILSLSLISGLRYSIRNLIAFMDGFSDEEKIKRISELTAHPVVRDVIRFYPPAHFLDWVYASLVRLRMNKFLYYLLQLR